MKLNQNLSIKLLGICFVAFLGWVLFLAVLMYRESTEKKVSPLITKTIHGVTNPFRIREKVGYYGSYELEEGGLKRSPMRPECSAGVYALMEDIPQVDLKAYLRQFDYFDLEKNPLPGPNQKYLVKGQMLETTWLSRNELKPSLVNPFDEKLKEQEKAGTVDISKQAHYSDFLECDDFLRDATKPAHKKRVFRRADHEFTHPQYDLNTLEAVVNDPDVLIKIKTTCHYTEVNYYSNKYKIFIRMMASIKITYGSVTNYVYNPDCS